MLGLSAAMNVPSDSPTSSAKTRRSLLLRVREHGDRSSWNEFHRLYRKLIYGLARRSGLSHADAEDVTQEVFLRVAQTIHQFEADPERGTFRGWLMNLTRWRIADRFGDKPAGEQLCGGTRDHTGTGGTGTLLRLPSPERVQSEWEDEWRQHVLEAACERIMRRVKPKHYKVFDLYVLRRNPVRQVSRELRINVAAVYLIGSRLTRQLRAEVAALRQQLG
jgi:RNA polymerase sigma factor (sigma-70 family)